MGQDRISGVLLHITSLPSYGGVGDLGSAAYEFVDFLAAAKQRLWQVLPLNPTGYGSSPYSALSAFAGNPILISLEQLVENGWLSREDIDGLPGHNGPADFGSVAMLKLPLVRKAAEKFLDSATEEQLNRYHQFSHENLSWLPDYSMFNVLRRKFEYKCWNEWPEEYAQRKHDALTSALTDFGRELAIEQVIQFFFDEQWSSLRHYCKQHDIRILGDVAIFVNYDSADVWTHPELFELDENRLMIRVSGVPPDYFSSTGQRWGNPLYRWGEFRQRGFDWWVARIRRTLALYDMVRLDHFRGFEAYWSIAADEETAVNGQWVKAPGQELFQCLRDTFGELPFIAEDLGLITPEVDELRERFGMPGMRILQFGFGERSSHLYLPHRFVPNTVVYTGTHDNNTTLGWWRDDATAEERANLQSYLQTIENEEEVVWAMIRTAARSVANLCIFPMQDVLQLGSDARMNTPAAGDGNWTWRFNREALKPEIAAKMASLMQMTDRDGYMAPKPEMMPPPS